MPELLMCQTNDFNKVVLSLYDEGGSFDGLRLECCGESIKGIEPIVKHLREISWGSSAASRLLQAMESRWPGIRSIK